MTHRHFTIGFLVLVIAGIVFISGCVQEEVRPEEQSTTSTITTKPEFVTAKLTSVKGGDFVSSADYYEGELILTNIITGKEYSLFVCSKSWNWVKEGSCYKFSPAEVNENIEQHKYSAELSGCYVGTLEQVSC